MENPKQQLIDRLKTANNVLITVSTDPSVDQLSAAIGLTLMLNKLDKHATAVFSGQTPSTIEFLEPEKTLEKNTDSLRDFIIALDKSKADKLRYKVEENQVRIFITPYKTSITEKDLDFSQGDFNVEVVVALGVADQKDLDHAITSHGRILHDATVASVTTADQSSLGTMNWAEPSASSLCEMIASLVAPLEIKELDGQVATALMTGIVAETERFSNEKTSSQTMAMSAALMAAGANQQLVASKLAEAATLEQQSAEVASEAAPASDEDGSLKIEHIDGIDESDDQLELAELPELDSQPVEEEQPETDQPEAAPDVEKEAPEAEEEPVEEAPEEAEEPVEEPADEDDQPPAAPAEDDPSSSVMTEPPQLGSKLTANTEPEALDPATDVLGVTPAVEESPKVILNHAQPAEEASEPSVDSEVDMPEPSMDLPSETADTPEDPDSQPLAAAPVQTLSDLEAAVKADEQDEAQPALETPASDSTQDISELLAASEDPAVLEPEATDPTESLDTARDAVSDALSSIGDESLPPIDALNAQPLGPELQAGVNGIMSEEEAAAQPTITPPATPTEPPAVPPPFMPNIPGFDPNAFEDISDPQSSSNT